MEEIMNKAKKINNKEYASIERFTSEQKTALVSSISLQKLKTTQKENYLIIGGKPKEQKQSRHPLLWSHFQSASNANLEEKISTFKKARPFRGKWFT